MANQFPLPTPNIDHIAQKYSENKPVFDWDHPSENDQKAVEESKAHSAKMFEELIASQVHEGAKNNQAKDNDVDFFNLGMSE